MIDRLIGLALVAVIGCLLLPAVARYATGAVPLLLSLLVLLGLLRLLLSPRRWKR